MIYVKETKRGVVIERTAYSEYYGAMVEGVTHGRRIAVPEVIAEQYRPADGDWSKPNNAGYSAADNLLVVAEEDLRFDRRMGCRVLAAGHTVR